MWKWLILALVAFLAWKWYKAGFVEVQDSGDTFKVKIRKLSGALGALNPLSKNANYNFGQVEGPRPNVDTTVSYWRTLSGSMQKLLPQSSGNTVPNSIVSGGLKRL